MRSLLAFTLSKKAFLFLTALFVVSVLLGTAAIVRNGGSRFSSIHVQPPADQRGSPPPPPPPAEQAHEYKYFREAGTSAELSRCAAQLCLGRLGLKLLRA
ncbi:hypothetical protein VTH06DRAFT_1057 [Thermothelomyces fergusii]